MRQFLLVLLSIHMIDANGQETKPAIPAFDTTSGKGRCYIVAGNGGGFTGLVTQYYVLRNGNVFKSASPANEKVFLKKLPAKEVKCIFQQLKSSGISKMEFDHPGNMSYFIETHQKGSFSKVTWGENGITAPKAILDLYRTVMDKVSGR